MGNLKFIFAFEAVKGLNHIWKWTIKQEIAGIDSYIYFLKVAFRITLAFISKSVIHYKIKVSLMKKQTLNLISLKMTILIYWAFTIKI